MRTALTTVAIPLLRLLEPERAHDLAIRSLGWGLTPRRQVSDDPSLAVEVLGKRFTNPIGLAAGFDKDAAAGLALFRLGFGFIETGSVTLRAQAGNPRPRIFRLREDQAVINRLGFNNLGLDVYLKNLGRLRGRPAPLGANLGLNKENANPTADYPTLLRAVQQSVDYVVINVSSPNTPKLRDLQSEDRLREILLAVAEVGNRPPVLVKVAPDLPIDALEAVIETCVAHQVQGLIVGNTTISRPAGLLSECAQETGGLSGRPLWRLSTAMLAHASLLARKRLVLIGTGGIFSGADVLTKIQAGASLVQLYTSFAYHGPALIPRLKSELLTAMRSAGFSKVTDAIGTRAHELAEPI
jgi:dihydroorotate dehydrogenase